MTKDFATELAQLLTGLNQRLAPLISELSQRLDPMVVRLRHSLSTTGVQVARELAQWDISMEVLGKAGWLPHCTIPYKDIAECGEDVEAVGRHLLGYYTDNWQDVRSRIESRVSGYSIDEEAEATFREALNAHEQGLYRCVCRVLFPEIERVFRVELFDNEVRPIGYKNIIDVLIKDKGIGEFVPGGLYQLTLFRHLMKALAKEETSEGDKRIYGLYQRVDTEEDRDRLQQDSIPNRHAAIHGLVVYSSQQNSLNMLFLADYVFEMMSGVKATSGQKR